MNSIKLLKFSKYKVLTEVIIQRNKINLKFKNCALQCKKIYDQRIFGFRNMTKVTYKCGGRWTTTEEENQIIKNYYARKSTAKLVRELRKCYIAVLGVVLSFLLIAVFFVVIYVLAPKNKENTIITYAPITEDPHELKFASKF